MPRPPLLSPLDWQALFEECLPYEDWLDAAESADQVLALSEALSAQTFEPHEEALLQCLARPVRVVAFAEDWCGDVVRHVPVLQAMADRSDQLTVRYTTRARHLDAFARFLTNGGEAVPKFVFLGGAYVECGNWGPMPADCRRLIARGKACGDVAAARKLVAARYAADPHKREVVQELLDLVQIAAAAAP